MAGLTARIVRAESGRCHQARIAIHRCTMKKLTVAVFAALGLLSLPAMAGEDSGFYAGAGIGQASVSTDAVAILEDQNYKFDADDTAFKIFGGWRFNKYVGLELDYVDLGSASDKDTFVFESQSIPVETEIGLSAFVPYVVGTLPLGIFELSAKVGYAFYDVDATVRAMGEHESFSDSDEDLAWGVGAGLTFFDHLNAKLEYEALEVSDADVEVIWLTGAWRF
jgi:opacity protein-like surface antigen